MSSPLSLQSKDFNNSTGTESNNNPLKLNQIHSSSSVTTITAITSESTASPYNATTIPGNIITTIPNINNNNQEFESNRQSNHKKDRESTFQTSKTQSQARRQSPHEPYHQIPFFGHPYLTVVTTGSTTGSTRPPVGKSDFVISSTTTKQSPLPTPQSSSTSSPHTIITTGQPGQLQTTQGTNQQSLPYGFAIAAAATNQHHQQHGHHTLTQQPIAFGSLQPVGQPFYLATPAQIPSPSSTTNPQGPQGFYHHQQQRAQQQHLTTSQPPAFHHHTINISGTGSGFHIPLSIPSSSISSLPSTITFSTPQPVAYAYPTPPSPHHHHQTAQFVSIKPHPGGPLQVATHQQQAVPVSGGGQLISPPQNNRVFELSKPLLSNPSSPHLQHQFPSPAASPKNPSNPPTPVPLPLVNKVAEIFKTTDIKPKPSPSPKLVGGAGTTSKGASKSGGMSHSFVCCLVDDGKRCDRTAGNASYSKKIQKQVSQRKLNLQIDPSVSHQYICEYHKNTIQNIR